MDTNDERLLPIDDHNPNCHEQRFKDKEKVVSRKGRCLR